MDANENQSQNILRHFQDLLIYPREDLDIELKGWLNPRQEEDKENIAQAILALANYGGGHIVIGFKEEDGKWVPDEDSRPVDLENFSQDLINGIVQSYAEPSFHCESHLVRHPHSDKFFPIIRVPGGHKAPIRSRRDGPKKKHVLNNTYYIRRPGPSSAPPRTGGDWDELIGRCVRANREDLLERIREIFLGLPAVQSVAGPQVEVKKRLDNWTNSAVRRWKELVNEKLASEKPSRYMHGVWSAAYCITGVIEQQDLSKFRDILQKVSGHETGWPPWWLPSRKEIEPYVYDGLIECWMVESYFGDASHSDFWRASPEGIMFLLRGYQEDDAKDSIKPGTFLDLTIPVWRVGECLLHAKRLSALLAGDSSSINFRVSWEGLGGRHLKAWADRGRDVREDRIAKQDKVVAEHSFESNEITTNLPEIVQLLTAPLYEVFDFFSPPMSMIVEELAKMRGSTRS